MRIARLSLIAAATAVSVYFVAAPAPKLAPSSLPGQGAGPEQNLIADRGDLPLEQVPSARQITTYKIVFEPVTVIGRSSHGHRR